MMKATTLMIAALGLLLSATTARAVTTVTDCSAAGPASVVNKKTVINLPGEDIVIQCARRSLPGSDQTQVTGASITVDGPNGGSVSSSGKGGQATLLKAVAGGVTVNGGSVTAANSNGDLVMMATGNISIGPGSTITAGGVVDISCSGPLCTIDVISSALAANKVSVVGNGTVTFSPASTISTSCPRDIVFIKSNGGDVLLGGGQIGGLGTICCNSVQALCSQSPTDPACPTAQNPIVLQDLQAVSAFCTDCLQEPNVIQTCVEGNVTILAPLGNIDVSNATIKAGETIIMTALFDVNMTNANINNCGKKTGVVVITGGGTCFIDNATILDDVPELAPTLNCGATSGVAALLGSCPAGP